MRSVMDVDEMQDDESRETKEAGWGCGWERALIPREVRQTAYEEGERKKKKKQKKKNRTKVTPRDRQRQRRTGVQMNLKRADQRYS